MPSAMDETNPDQQEVARLEYIDRIRLKHDAYVSLFGPPGRLNPTAATVLKDLEGFVRYRESAITRDLQGRYDGGATAYNTGLQDVVKRIYEMIAWSEEPPRS
jgi:hypothetical protein